MIEKHIALMKERWDIIMVKNTQIAIDVQIIWLATNAIGPGFALAWVLRQALSDEATESWGGRAVSRDSETALTHMGVIISLLMQITDKFLGSSYQFVCLFDRAYRFGWPQTDQCFKKLYTFFIHLIHRAHLYSIHNTFEGEVNS